MKGRITVEAEWSKDGRHCSRRCYWQLFTGRCDAYGKNLEEHRGRSLRCPECIENEVKK